ncbi:MAG: SDR family NAD(P)-dependent oxidoreductase [Ilumatobacteraceae bacterium]
MAWTTDDIPDQTGRTTVVTGANGGLGLETAKALAAAGATVVVAARDPAKTTAAVAAIASHTPGAELDVVAVDLGSLESVREAAATILGRHDRIDILVNNAGLMAIPERSTDDGFEMQLGVNHLGHFVLTARLLPAVLHAGGRVVAVTSTAHHIGRRIDDTNPHLHGRYKPWRRTASRSSPTTTSPSGCTAGCSKPARRRQAFSPIPGSPTPSCSHTARPSRVGPASGCRRCSPSGPG